MNLFVSPMKAVALGTTILFMLALQGCWFAAGAATGAAATEVMHDEGYEIDSPIEKEDEADDLLE